MVDRSRSNLLFAPRAESKHSQNGGALAPDDGKQGGLTNDAADCVSLMQLGGATATVTN